MPRFALLFHDCPANFGKPSHWDLMLERNSALMTWSVPELPASWRLSQANEPTAVLELDATRLSDHRLAYLDYEGPVSGDRGHVTHIDRGDYVVLEETANWLRVRLNGAVAHGEVSLPIDPPPQPEESPPSP